ncbi:Glutamate--tRNA ligase 1 [Rickettsiales bacterium Ac37b]|nr:Glutamate--tRNA ligase 1 [Rickettsiales bacterium Ac37b]
MSIVTRFAPSPTGLLHVGNIRTALVNFLYARKFHGKFMLRIDDTDLERSKKEYEEQLKIDLKWLGLEWDFTINQSSRLKRYEQVKDLLLQQGKLYPCYETSFELDMKRKIQLNAGLPPIYDRAALKLTEKQKEQLHQEGKKPHYRFLLDESKETSWNDLVKDKIVFEGRYASDPVLIREDGSMTYILSSVVDDIDFAISHIIRGEDHVTNTAVQIQIFESLNVTPPNFAHLALIKAKEGEISKRLGGFDIKGLREAGIEAMTINSFLAKLGTSKSIVGRSLLQELVDEFDLSNFTLSPTSYQQEDLLKLNHKLLSILSFEQIRSRVDELGLHDIGEDFWLLIRDNLENLNDIKEWWNICKQPLTPIIEDKLLTDVAIKLLPNEDLSIDSWSKWMNILQNETNKKGKNLFLPIRLALTAKSQGPELKYLLPILGKDKIIARLSGKTA